MSKIGKYKGLSKTEKLFFREAVRKMYYCKVLLLIFSFKKAISIIGKTKSSKNHDRELIINIKLAVTRSNHLSTWKNKCLVSTLVARWMLNKRHIDSKAFLGLKKGEEKLEAHAWITADEIDIVETDGEYTKVLEF